MSHSESIRILVQNYANQRLRRYELGTRISFAESSDSQWFDASVPITTDGSLYNGLTQSACRIINAVMLRWGGVYEIYIYANSIYLVRENKGSWDEVDTAMLSIIKDALWPNQAVEMWNI